ncbi:serpin family protein [Candidatus Clostridium radicumherbarum]|uniref:Serpin family protein n=1 Tax=Candidatus Clostridium radicumherbarum TaxID=3381662 RepID=A0ABW8TTM6_9CLOT
MKKLTALIITMGVIIGMTGCSSNGTKAINNSVTNPIQSKDSNLEKADVINAAVSPVYPKSIAFGDYDGWFSVKKDNKLEDSFSNSLKDFSNKSTSLLLKNQTKNISYSPVSLYMALSLASSGATGATQEEMLKALNAGDKKTDFISEQNGKLFRLLYTNNDIGKLNLANSLWLNKGNNFKKSFLDNASKNFYASIFNIDFKDQNSSKLMSDWISKNTNGILTPQINFGKEQIMSIINTIYFKDQWADKFDVKATKKDTFYLKNGDEVKCDFMNRTYVTHSFIKGDGFTSSTLSLKNSNSMIFILPDKGISADSLLESPEKVATLFDEKDIKNGKVIFQIPKFSYGSSLSLKETLNCLGIKKAFEKTADFSGITEGTAFISDIKQETHVAIDEKGVEAAAFTQIDYSGSAPPKDEKAEMILNRPFIYAIKGSTGDILFVGVVNNPNEK